MRDNKEFTSALGPVKIKQNSYREVLRVERSKSNFFSYDISARDENEENRQSRERNYIDLSSGSHTMTSIKQMIRLQNT